MITTFHPRRKTATEKKKKKKKKKKRIKCPKQRDGM